MRLTRMALTPVFVTAMMAVCIPSCSSDDPSPTPSAEAEPTAVAKAPTTAPASDTDVVEATSDIPADTGLPRTAIQLSNGRATVTVLRESLPRDTVVTRDILAKWNAWQRVSFKSSFKYERTQPGSRRQQTGNSKTDYAKRDGVVFIHNESANAMGIERMPDEFVQTGERKLEIFDADFVHTLQTVHSGVYAFKRHRWNGQVNVIGGPRLLAAITSSTDLTLAPDELVDGFPTYVFKTRELDGQVETDYYIDQDTGLLRKTELRDHRKDSVLTYTYGEYDFDPSFPDDHFTFKLPEDIELKDSTQTANVVKLPSPKP